MITSSHGLASPSGLRSSLGSCHQSTCTSQVSWWCNAFSHFPPSAGNVLLLVVDPEKPCTHTNPSRISTNRILYKASSDHTVDLIQCHIPVCSPLVDHRPFCVKWSLIVSGETQLWARVCGLVSRANERLDSVPTHLRKIPQCRAMLAYLPVYLAAKR